ncbi:MAG TPA: glycosyltransferase family 4 protein [Cyclobacteriaceae bacterium]
MNIGMLLNAPYPSDMRIRKEALALLGAGFRVYLLCLRRRNEKETEVIEGITITRIRSGTNDVGLAFWDVIMSMQVAHPRFRKAIIEWVKKYDIKALHVHDLPLVGTALSTREQLDIPVIADFHENYPEAIKAWFEWKKNPIARLKNKLFMNPSRWTEIERNAVLKSDHVIAVVDEMKARLIDQYGASADTITVITNTEELDFLHQESFPDIYDSVKGNFIVTYSGNIGPHRGVDTVIGAMRHLVAYPIVLIIVGKGRRTVMDRLKAQVLELNVSRQVYFLGHQPFAKFFSYMRFADVNVIPHKSNAHTDNTVPHKLFEAMMVGKPVLVSSSTPLKRIVSSTNSGLVFQAGSSHDCSEKILELFRNKELCQRLGNNGVHATLHGGLNWETTQKSLIDLYRSLVV